MGPARPARGRAAAMRLAEELRLPLVTVIDTPGAELSPRAEEGAIAGEIARCIATPDHDDRADRRRSSSARAAAAARSRCCPPRP